LEIVDVKKVFDALTWLKRNNPLYSHIILPNYHSQLCLTNLKNLEFYMEEAENNKKVTLNDKYELSNLIEETKNDVEIILEDQQKAMLTQVIDENDGYEQYTIQGDSEQTFVFKKINC